MPTHTLHTWRFGGAHRESAQANAYERVHLRVRVVHGQHGKWTSLVTDIFGAVYHVERGLKTWREAYEKGTQIRDTLDEARPWETEATEQLQNAA